MRIRNLAALAAATLGIACAAQADAPATQPGRWQPQTVDFVYMGFTSIYSCDGLQATLETLLKASGAAPEIKVIQQCARGPGRLDRMARLQLRFATLQPDTTAAGVTSGEWRHVKLAPYHPTQLQAGTCEVVEQFRDSVLKYFATRNVVNHVTCPPHQEPVSYDLSFDVFTAAPTPTAK